MADISQELSTIQNATKGSDMRFAIASAIEKINSKGCIGGNSSGTSEGTSGGGFSSGSTSSSYRAYESRVNQLKFKMEQLLDLIRVYQASLENHERQISTLEGRTDTLLTSMNTLQSNINSIKTSGIQWSNENSGVNNG